MFIYTKNEDVIKQLELEKARLIKRQDNGVVIYALPPSSKFLFDKQENTTISNTLIF